MKALIYNKIIRDNYPIINEIFNVYTDAIISEDNIEISGNEGSMEGINTENVGILKVIDENTNQVGDLIDDVPVENLI